MSKELLPLGLRSVIESGKGVLFLGAGIGYSAFDTDGNSMPDASALTKEMASHFKIPTASADLARVSQVVEQRHGRTKLLSFLSTRLAAFEPNENLRWLLGLTWRAIFTTNYDRLIARCYALSPNPTQTPILISSTSELRCADPRLEVPVYHLHGALYGVPKPDVLITENDYVRFDETRRMMFEILKNDLATCTMLYVGYSNTDPNWRQVRDAVALEFAPSPMPQSYRVAPVADPIDVEILENQGISCIDSTLDDFVTDARSAVGDLRVEPSRLDKIRDSVPTDLHGAFDNNPASTLRLLASWTYVNQAAFDASPNIVDFLRGERPNWSLVGNQSQFKRDIEEDVYDVLLDYATALKTRQPVVRVLGSAGYGITTVLMSLAAQLVRDQAGPVFMHRSGNALAEGDIEFACSIFDSRPFFFVDNAADNASALERGVIRARESRSDACFVVGERRNQWRQLHSGQKANEFMIEPLSDPEIYRLLACLESHTALGVLADLPENLRVAAIHKKHDRQLLVVMRESTEGRAFDAIIESEYLGLGTDLAQKMYAVTACAYQLRQPIRDQLLADVVGVSLVDLYSETKDATDGVVEFECVDDGQGKYVARCRHHSIAEIVWHRCILDHERRVILLALIQKLNLDYHPDYQLFSYLVKSDREVDSLGSSDFKDTFFQIATKKAPLSGYVRQQAARMLLRTKRFERALGEVEEAIKLGPNVPMYKHTRGVVLREMAIENSSVDLGRKRLAQSEADFNEIIRTRPWDHYAFQSLAELYLRWAQRLTEEGEASTYVAKCQQVIQDGLKTVRQRDGLWIVSGQLEKWLGNEPNAIKILQQAAGSTVGRYLLARMWMKKGDAVKALEILQTALEEDPTDPRVAIMHAKAQLMLGEPYRNATAVLELAKLYGMRDARYVAMLGGMLFVDGEFSDAEAVFAASRRNSLPIEEEQHIHFRPRANSNSNEDMRLVGIVSSVKAGFSFIVVNGYPPIFCPGSKYNGIIMRQDLRVEFTLGFNARGAVALIPKQV